MPFVVCFARSSNLFDKPSNADIEKELVKKQKQKVNPYKCRSQAAPKRRVSRKKGCSCLHRKAPVMCVFVVSDDVLQDSRFFAAAVFRKET